MYEIFFTNHLCINIFFFKTISRTCWQSLTVEIWSNLYIEFNTRRTQPRLPDSLEWSRSNQYDREPSHSPFGRNKRFQKNKRWKSNATAAWKKSNASPQSGWGTARTCRKPVTVAYNRASNLRSYSNMHRLHFNPSRHDRSSLTDCVIPIDGVVKHCTRVKHATVWNRDYAAFAGSAYSRIA